MIARLGLAALTTGVVAAVAALGQGQAPAPVAATAGQADWTLMIYDVADTSNIADDMIANLAAFAAVPDAANVNVVALVDLPEQSEPDYPSATLPGVAPFTTAKLLQLDGGRWNEIRDYGEVSMGRPDVLAGFVEEAAGRFPADKYGLVLSDHGSGAAGGYYDDGPPAPSHLDLRSLRSGLVAGMQAADIDRFEFINHDACLMANYETASALGPLTEVMVASEEVTFGSGTLSNEALAALSQDISGEEWGRTNNEAYGEYADQAGSRAAFTAASVVDGDQLSRLDAAVDSFSAVAVEHMAEIAPEVGRARSAALEFVTGIDPSSPTFDLVDLGDFLRHLQDVPPDVAVARDAVFGALDAAVLSQVTRQATQQATGLNVFFPQDPASAQRYLDDQVGPPGWRAFVQAYVDAGAGPAADDSPTTATFVSQQAQVLQQDGTGILVAGQLGDGMAQAVVDTETQVYAEVSGQQALALVLPGYLDAGAVGQVQGAWSYQLTALGNPGEQPVPVSSIYQAQSGGLIGTVYARYQPAAGEAFDVQFRLLLDSTGQVTGVTVSQAGSSGSAPVTLDGGTLTPYVVVETAGGFGLSATDEQIAVTPDLEVSFPRLPTGTAFDIGVVVSDLSGGSDGAFATAQVQGGGGQGRGALRIGEAPAQP